MINAIETALVARLKAGLGRMVREVKSYAGELDSEHWAKAIGQVPAVWVSYGGAQIKIQNTAQTRYEQSATFAVMAATRSLRSEQAGRQGGALLSEIGSNALIHAILRLLSGQRLGGLLDSHGLVPQNVRLLLKNAYIGASALTVVALEFKGAWSFRGLKDGAWPAATNDQDHPDWIFSVYGGQQTIPDPDLKGVNSVIYDPKNDAHIESELKMERIKLNESESS